MKVGFIGVGNIGQPMAKQLLSNGFNLLVNDIHKENSLSLTNAGAIWVDNPEDLAKQCDFVCTCLPGPTQMEQLIIGPNGILNSMNENTVYIDHTTNSFKTVQNINGLLSKKGIHMLDAPVSGGVEGAKTRDLTLLVGGDQKIVNKSMPILNAIGKTVLHVGNIGTGTICKLMHNSASLSMMLTMVQCLTTGVKAGVDASTIVEVFQKCALGRNFDLQVRLPNTLFQGNFDPRFSLKLAYKDLKLAMEIADEFKVPFSIPEICEKEMSEAISRGLDAKDSSIFLTIQEEKAGVEIRTTS
jgi:3-hydroxyisobutyrate dehydrogenase